jgi:hypothetical protein
MEIGISRITARPPLQPKLYVRWYLVGNPVVFGIANLPVLFGAKGHVVDLPLQYVTTVRFLGIPGNSCAGSCLVYINNRSNL